jgi:hypothetical protein
MDASILTALSGVLGALVGGSATFATTWVNQKMLGKRGFIQDELRRREALYGEFIAECAKLFVDAFTHSLEKPEKLLGMYALINRIRLVSSPPVLERAEHLLRRVTEQYFAANMTVEEMRRIALSDEADPLKAFGEACRAELLAMSASL